jgi:hypothetical protein
MTTLEITKGIKNSLLSDQTIKICLDLHQNNPGVFDNFITKLERDMDMMLLHNYSIYDAFLYCKEVRTIRLSNDNSLEMFERTLIRMVGELCKYRKEIIFGDMMSQVKVLY